MYTTVKVDVVGDPDPPHIDPGSILYNGGFDIIGFSSPVGDGTNEFTKWDFDLSMDPEYQNFDPSIRLENAILIVTLTRGIGHFFTDSVRIQGLAQIHITEEKFGWVPINQRSVLQFNLLEHYTSAEILNSINTENIIIMEYQDDALLNKAELILSQPVPTVMRVADLDSEVNPRMSLRGDWQTTVKVTILDPDDGPIRGAIINCNWPEIDLFDITGTTNWQGEYSFTSPWISGDIEQVKFNIKDVEHDVHSYDPKLNVDRYPLDAETNILVQKPQFPREPVKK